MIDLCNFQPMCNHVVIITQQVNANQRRNLHHLSIQPRERAVDGSRLPKITKLFCRFIQAFVVGRQSAAFHRREHLRRVKTEYFGGPKTSEPRASVSTSES